MQKRFVLLPMALAIAGVMASAGVRAEGIEYHGYTRIQAGGTTEGGNLQCFSGAYPVRSKYRLGNECDNYSEHSIGLGFGDTNDVWAKYHLTLALQDKGSEPDNTIGDSFNMLHRENFFEAGGFFSAGALENAKVWVGKRFYNRHDIHMSDYYYWTNNGVGGGIEEIQAGPAKLSLAYMQNSPNANAVNDLNAKRYSLRFYDISLGEKTKLEGELVAIKGSTAGTTPAGSGQALFLKLAQDGVLGGFNHIAVVLGKDAGGNGFEWLPTYAGGGEADSKSFRIHDHLYFDFKGTNITGMATASYAEVKPGTGDKQTWISYGVRPQYNFTKNFSIAAEVGRDQGKQGASKPTMTKLTIAPQLALAAGAWARPVLRGFVTHAKWNGDNGTVANGVFGAKKAGTSFGVQAEAWW
ncbi:maltoporin [Sphaerotilus mobilis]|uniref:Maltoporin n=1 Tax=Sphaerotilus mobilis TaxID=47994 RepID=A0A4Q7LKL2_9BURK|nr:carbohydrate porin [Sphaerotilus mobilis]RZS54712.1 maltoporin [Sphaerotilus mobilis]